MRRGAGNSSTRTRKSTQHRILLWLSGKAILGELLALIKEMISPAMIAAIAMMCAFFVDKDEDGIPDKFESEDKKNGKL